MISGGASSQPAVAAGPDGSAVIAWRASQVASEASNRWAPIRAAVLDPEGHLSAPRTLSRADGDSPRGDGVEQPQCREVGPDQDDDADGNAEQAFEDEPGPPVASDWEAERTSDRRET